MSELSFDSSISIETTESSIKMGEVPVSNPLQDGIAGSSNIHPLEGESVHPGYQRVIEAIDMLKVVQSPIDFAFFLHKVNDYLEETIRKKERKLNRKGPSSNATLSDAASMISGNFRALQEQYESSVYEGGSIWNGTRSYNYTQHNGTRYQNSLSCPQSKILEDSFGVSSNSQLRSKFPLNSRLIDNFSAGPPSIYKPAIGVNSSMFNKVKNKPLDARLPPIQEIETNNSSAPRKFTEIEDTFGSACNNESMRFAQNNKSNNSKAFQSFHSQIKTIPPTSTFYSSFRNKVNSSVPSSVNNSFVRSLPMAQESSDGVKDQFSIVHVGTPSKNFCLPLHNIEDQSDNERVETQNNTATESDSFSETSTLKKKSAVKRLKKLNSTIDESNIILKNWTVLLVNKSLHLKGVKIKKNKILDKNHVSEAIICRTRDGKVKTKDCIYTLNGPLATFEDMPSSVQLFFRRKMFPCNWRNALATWVSSASQPEDNEPSSKSSKPKVLEKNVQETLVTNGKKQITLTATSSKKIKKTPPSKKKVQKKPEVKSRDNAKKLITNKKKETESSVTKTKNTKTNKLVETSSSSFSSDEEELVDKRKNGEELNMSDVIKSFFPSSSSESEQKNNRSEGASGENIKKTFGDLFGENNSKYQERLLTPSALLRSINKSPKFLNGRQTPPLKMIGEFVNQNRAKSGEDKSQALLIGTKGNPVTKRMAKLKQVKAKNRKKNKDSNVEESKDVKNIMAALTNRTPQTTPQVVREVFRRSNDSDDSDFGSDVSSIRSS